WNPQLDEVRHRVFALIAVCFPLRQVPQKHFDSNLIGNREIKIRSLWRKVPDKLGLCWFRRSNEWNRPRPFVRTPTPLRGNRLSGCNRLARAGGSRQHRPRLRTGPLQFIAEDLCDVLAEM